MVDRSHIDEQVRRQLPDTPPQRDPSTPMLTHADVYEYVRRLPSDVLAVLAQGPIERPRECRACDALASLVPQSANQLVEAEEDIQGAAFAAQQLQAWHDDLGFSERYGEVIIRHVVPIRQYNDLVDEGHDILGQIAYARCCTMYTLAELELTRRGEQDRIGGS